MRSEEYLLAVGLYQASWVVLRRSAVLCVVVNDKRLLELYKVEEGYGKVERTSYLSSD